MTLKHLTVYSSEMMFRMMANDVSEENIVYASTISMRTSYRDRLDNELR